MIITLRFLYLASSKFNIYLNTRGIIVTYLNLVYAPCFTNQFIVILINKRSQSNLFFHDLNEFQEKSNEANSFVE